MKRLQRLKQLKSKLENLKLEAENLRATIINEDGRIDFKKYTEVNMLYTEISILKKKISFAEQGRGYLGEELSNSTPRVSTHD
jgi:predicted RNase H-like nuclease (RuvC/YqgF family)